MMRIQIPITICAGWAILVCTWCIAQDVQQETNQIKRLLTQLNDAEFVRRERAMKLLIELGCPVVKPLVAILPNADAEVRTRGMFVLGQLARSVDPQTEQTARRALRAIADEQASTLARPAAAELIVADRWHQDRALSILQQHGAALEQQWATGSDGQVRLIPAKLEIGDRWQGKPDHLRHLSRLFETRQILLSGKQIDDQLLGRVSQLPDLQTLSIKRATITDQGLKHLASARQLSKVEIYYCPITDQSIPTLRQFSGASTIALFGTQITVEGAARLRKLLSTATIDHRKGGFLGIGCQTIGGRCVVTRVEPDTVAAEHEFQVHDVVLKIADQPVQSSEGLLRVLGQFGAGESITIEFVRNGKPDSVTLKLGQWP